MAKDLATRVRGAAVAEQAGGTAPTLRQLIERMRPELARALPKHLDPDRIARIAITLVAGNKQLAQCTPESFLGALMTASQLGLEPGPLGEAYLVPYGKKVTFIPGYRGLIKLAWQSGQLKSISAHVVCANDEFDYAYGLEPMLRHKPALTDRGEVVAVYAAAVLKDGGSAFVVLSRDDVEKIRKRSMAATNGPWVTDWDAMARKTAVRQLARWLPMSSELRTFDTAAALDGSTRTDITGSVDEQLPTWVDDDDQPAALDPASDPPATRPAEPRDPGSTDVRVWHDRGHTRPGSTDRRDAWHPDCSLCKDDDAGANHYYAHNDPEDGCGYCASEVAWKAAAVQDGA